MGSESKAEENERWERSRKAGDETIVKQLAKLYTKCITERHIHETEKCDNPTEEFHTFTI